MKYLILILCLLITISSVSQEISLGKETSLPQLKAGSCGSPDGPTTQISAPPPNYQYLDDNGYCLYSYGPGLQTACFTMTSPGTDISFNAGYTNTCANVSFGNFELYDASCTLVGTGTSFTGLSPGATYTWCISMNTWGGGPTCTGLSSFCPYYIDNTTPLPVELLSFYGEAKDGYNLLLWSTASEINSESFQVMHFTDMGDTSIVATIPGSGNSNSIIQYQAEHRNPLAMLNYYYLVQRDFDGEYEKFVTIVINNKREPEVIIKRVNMLGQEVNENYKGITILLMSDGSIKKMLNFN